MCFPAAVGFLTVSSVITMSAPFFLGKIIDVIYTNPSADYSSSLTRLSLALGGVFLCGAAANAVRVYLMQTSGATTHLLGHMGWGLGGRISWVPCAPAPMLSSLPPPRGGQGQHWAGDCCRSCALCSTCLSRELERSRLCAFRAV